jgi:NADH:ubiquinone oxidoreductase subunit C
MVEIKAMDTEKYLAQAEAILRPYGRVINHPSPDRLDISILPGAIQSVMRAMAAEHWGYLVAITGVDRPGISGVMPEDKQWSRLAREDEGGTGSQEHEGSIELLYTFCHQAAIVTLRTSVRYSFPVIHTVCDVFPAATLYERELIEMFGVKVVGTPNKEKLLLPDDWPDGVFPLRKTFKGLEEIHSAGEK